MGTTERTFRRWSTHYEAEGVEGLKDKRLGQGSAHAALFDAVLQMVTLYESRYAGWTVKHFHERWYAEHRDRSSYTWTKNRLQAAGQVTRARRRRAHRKTRPRKPLPGMMLHQDGSRHECVPDRLHIIEAMRPRIVARRPTGRKIIRRAAEKSVQHNRRDHVLHTPDNLTCYLQICWMVVDNQWVPRYHCLNI